MATGSSPTSAAMVAVRPRAAASPEHHFCLAVLVEHLKSSAEPLDARLAVVEGLHGGGAAGMNGSHVPIPSAWVPSVFVRQERCGSRSA